MKPSILDELRWVGYLLAAIAVAVLLWNFDPFGRRRAAENHAASAEAQAATNQSVATATDHFTHDVTVIHDRTDKALSQVQQAPGSETPIDPDRRSILCAALAGVRGKSVCEADDDGSSQPPGPLHSSNQPNANPG